jgi:general secretion pathway protein G|tara:strand:+ start:279 stop:716 length:438 start_codon:yes stop_codon:yes gene_type:complete
VGFTLLELLICVAIIGLLTAIALPGYQGYVDSTNNGLAEADLVRMEQAIEVYYNDTVTYPPALEDIGFDVVLDPWDNTYQYLRFDENTKTGEMRKDKNLVPVNGDYGLYSMGKDGGTAMPFNSGQGQDDIVRANNGRYIGLASDY